MVQLLYCVSGGCLRRRCLGSTMMACCLPFTSLSYDIQNQRATQMTLLLCSIVSPMSQKTIRVRESKFGTALVVETSEFSGGYVLGEIDERY